MFVLTQTANNLKDTNGFDIVVGIIAVVLLGFLIVALIQSYKEGLFK